MVSICPLISKSSSPCVNPSVTVPRAPITIGITVTFMFLSFFNSQTRSRSLSFFSLSFNFTKWSAGTAKFTIHQVSFLLLLLIMTRSGRLAEIRRSVCVSKPPRSLCVSFSWTDFVLSIYHLLLFYFSRVFFFFVFCFLSLALHSGLLLEPDWQQVS